MEEIGQFFVMLHIGENDYTPLIDAESDKIAKFYTVDDAMTAGEENTLGEAYGFEVFEMGTGDWG
jgi:hypothetical protein